MRIQSGHSGKALRTGCNATGATLNFCLSSNLMLPFCICETHKVVSPLPLSPLNSCYVLYISSHPICFSTCPKWLGNSLFSLLCDLQSDLLYGSRDVSSHERIGVKTMYGPEFWGVRFTQAKYEKQWFLCDNTNISSDVQLSCPREMSS